MSKGDCYYIGKAIIEMHKLYERLADKIKEKHELNSFLDATRQEVTRLKDIGSAFQTRIKQLENINRTLQEDNIQKKEKLEEEQASNAHLNEQCKRLTSQLKVAQKKTATQKSRKPVAP